MPMFKQGDDAVATADTEAVARPTDAAATADDTPAAEVAGVAEDEEPRAPEKEVGNVAEFKIGACFTGRCSLEPIGKLNEAQMVTAARQLKVCGGSRCCPPPCTPLKFLLVEAALAFG